MNWNDLRLFLALRRAGSFAGAGRELGVNATTIARGLADLEEDVGAQLFTRTRDGLVPTAAAETMVEPAELIERQTQLIERAVGGQDALLAGTVRLAVTQTFATSFLVDHLGAFRRAHPAIELELNTSDLVVDLARGDADVAVRFRPPGSGPGVPSSGPVELVAKRVSTMGISVFAARDYLERAGVPKSATDVSGHDIVMPRSNASYLPGFAWSQSVESCGRVAVRSDSLEGLGAASAAGFGLCAMPSFLGLRHENLQRIAPPKTIDSREVWLIMPGDIRRVARVRAVWDFMADLFATWDPVLSGAVIPNAREAR